MATFISEKKVGESTVRIFTEYSDKKIFFNDKDDNFCNKFKFRKNDKLNVMVSPRLPNSDVVTTYPYLYFEAVVKDVVKNKIKNLHMFQSFMTPFVCPKEKDKYKPFSEEIMKQIYTGFPSIESAMEWGYAIPLSCWNIELVKNGDFFTFSTDSKDVEINEQRVHEHNNKTLLLLQGDSYNIFVSSCLRFKKSETCIMEKENVPKRNVRKKKTV